MKAQWTGEPPEGRIFPVGKAKIYCRVAGSGSPLVLIHGLSGSSRWWARNAPYFSQKHCVYQVDLIGFGRSRGQQFWLSEAAEILAQWMGQLGLEKADVIGHSMGGYIAIDLAANYKQQVNRLVLVDALALPVGRTYARSTLALVESLRFMPLDFLPVLLSDALRAGPRTLWNATREVLEADIRADLALIEDPALIVWGENDTLLPLDVGRQLHAHLPKADFVVIPEAGHNPMWDHPEAFNRVVGDFLD